MNLNIYLKLVIKKLLGTRLPGFKSSQNMLSYLRQVIPLFMKERLSGNPADKRFLIVTFVTYDPAEAIYAKAVEAIGYETHILTSYDPFIKKIFKIFGIDRIHYYDDFLRKVSSGKFRREAEDYLRNVPDEAEILKLVKNGMQVGKYAVSSVMRLVRKSNFDIRDDSVRRLLAEQLAYSLKMAAVAEIILREVKPDCVFLIDHGYTPNGQLFDACLNRGIPVIQRNASHKSGWDILKRYKNPEMSTYHHHSLSKESWEYIRKMPWDNKLWDELYGELKRTYVSGDWFAEVGTQFNKNVYSKQELFSMMHLDAGKKTVVIFPHIFWDATFFWGEDLFKDYYDWFINVLKAAAENKKLNWIIKIHPANIIKAKRDNYKGEHVELKAVYETLGSLPEHIKVIPPESDINTFSLFEVMDYCLTVRGTIGIEASAMGINTLTAGTGRYDRMGFTHDFKSKEEYLECIRSLENMPPMSGEMVELARRYAYGIFILRAIHLDLLDHGYNQDEKGTIRFRPLFKTREEFEQSGFVQKLRRFVASDKEDYLNLPGNSPASK